jgi:hypothetical protein
MHRAPPILFTAAVLAVPAALACPAAAQVCAPDGAVVFVPKHYSVQSIQYMQAGDAPVRITLWTDRLGPRTTDNTMTSPPKGIWTPSAITNPIGFQVNDDKSWRLGFDALYAETDGDYAKPFECVGLELHANGPDPWGFYVLKFIPHALDPAQVAFEVRVSLRRGPIQWPRPPAAPKATAK